MPLTDSWKAFNPGMPIRDLILMHTVFSVVLQPQSTVHVSFAAHQISLLLLQLMALSWTPPENICPGEEGHCQAA